MKLGGRTLTGGGVESSFREKGVGTEKKKTVGGELGGEKNNCTERGKTARRKERGQSSRLVNKKKRARSAKKSCKETESIETA